MLTAAQEKALELIRHNGRFGVGAFGGIRWPTAKALVKTGLVRLDYENWNGRRMAFVYPIMETTPEEMKVLLRLFEGPVATNKLVRSTRVSLRHLEKDLGLIEYDGDEWQLTMKGLALCESTK